MNKAYYMANSIDNLSGYSLAYKNNFINEFLINTKFDAYKIQEECLKNNISINPINKNQILFAVTERRTKDEIEKLVSILGHIN